MSDFAEYVAVLLLAPAKSLFPHTSYSAGLDGLVRKIKNDWGIDVPKNEVVKATNILSKFAACEEFTDALTGSIYKIEFDNFSYYFLENEPSNGDEKLNYDQIREEVRSKFPVLKIYAEIGVVYPQEIVEKLKSFDSVSDVIQKLNNPQLLLQDEYPAADRIVTRKDNYALVSSIENSLQQISVELKSSNEVGETIGDQRLIFSSELEAAKNLISFERFSLDSLKRLLMPMLQFLAKAFANGTIGALAEKLIEALM